MVFWMISTYFAIYLSKYQSSIEWFPFNFPSYTSDFRFILIGCNGTLIRRIYNCGYKYQITVVAIMKVLCLSFIVPIESDLHYQSFSILPSKAKRFI